MTYSTTTVNATLSKKQLYKHQNQINKVPTISKSDDIGFFSNYFCTSFFNVFNLLSCYHDGRILILIQISQKEKLFQSHKKLRAIWGSLTLHHHSFPLSKKTFLFPSFWPSREYKWHLFEKNFLICFSPLSPQVE